MLRVLSVPFLQERNKAPPASLLGSGLGALLGDGSQGVLAGQIDATLLVDVRNHDEDGIADSNDILHMLDAMIVQLGDVDQALFARCDLNESTEVHQAGHAALVDGANLRVLHDHEEINGVAVNQDDLLKYKEPELSKTALKTALKAGLIVPGATVKTSFNLQIK